MFLRIHGRLSTIFKVSKKKRIKYWFLICKTLYILYIAGLELRVRDLWITNQFLDPMNQKFVIAVKKCPLFLLQSPTCHSLTFNLRFLYELRHKVCLCKTLCGIFHFRFRLVFIKVYVFAQQNSWILRL